MKWTKWILAASLTAILAAWGCSSLDPIQPTAVSTGKADFARYHAVGNSLTAGFQSGGLVAKYQKQSYPAMIAQAARAGTFQMPLVSEPGIPPLMFVKSFSPVTLDTLDGLGSPTNSTYAGIYNNLGIPGATLHDVLVRRPTGVGDMYDVVLRDSTLFGPTAVVQAAAAQPTFMTVWLGANDILGSASKGTNLLLTPAAAFEADYRSVMNTFAGTGADIVAANLPDITAIPFFRTVLPVLVNPATRQVVINPGNGQPVPLIGEFQGGSGPLPLTSLVTLVAAGYLAQGVGIPVSFGGTGAPLPDFVIVDPTELAAIQARLGEFNTVIDTVCADRNIPVVDMFAYFQEIGANGTMIRGEEYTAEYLSGGLFSVDGVHPSSLGYYVLAKKFIEVINASFGAALPDPALPVNPSMTAVPRASLDTVGLPVVETGVFDGLWRALGVDPPARRRSS